MFWVLLYQNLSKNQTLQLHYLLHHTSEAKACNVCTTKQADMQKMMEQLNVTANITDDFVAAFLHPQ